MENSAHPLSVVCVNYVFGHVGVRRVNAKLSSLRRSHFIFQVTPSHYAILSTINSARIKLIVSGALVP